MIQQVMTYDIVPGVDQQAYQAWTKATIGTMMRQSGLVEFRAHRNMLGTPQVRTTTEWQSLADFEKFWLGPWQPIDAELRKFATNIRVELWGPSPNVPEPLRPSK
jgi:Antibiotic biosynthesis monooxygenase